MVNLNVNYATPYCGPGIDFVVGSRIKDYLFVGGGLSLHTLFSYREYSLMPICYCNVRGYLPVCENFMPFLDVAAGMHVGEHEGVYFVFYTHIGLGFEYKFLDFSFGYESNIANTGYFKIGVNF